jgi:hypothetical protein
LNTGCLHVVPAKPVKYGEDEEENRKIDVIEAQRRCPKCNAMLTKYVHKVWDAVKDNEEVCKVFGVVSGDAKKIAEAKQTTYKVAKKETEEHAKKLREEAQRRGAV